MLDLQPREQADRPRRVQSAVAGGVQKCREDRMTRIGTLTIAGLALSLLLLLVGPAGAATVTLTEGTFTLWLMDTDFRASGPSITLQEIGPFAFLPQPVGGGLVLSVLELGGSNGAGGFVTVNGVTCSFGFGATPCGTLAFLSPPTIDP